MSRYIDHRRKLNRHPSITSLTLSPDMADTGEGQVHPGHQRLTGRHLLHDRFAGGNGLFLVDIKLERHARPGELDGMGMDQIAPDEQVLAFGFPHHTLCDPAYGRWL